MRYSLRQIEVFVATARLETISRAADHLSMSQSAASSALQDLESRYDTILFDRVGKRLKINSNGKELLPYAEALLSHALEVESVIQQHEPSGALNIGATLTIGNYVAIQIVSQFKKDLPKTGLHLHVANTAQIAQRVINFELDIGLIEGEYMHEDLSITQWCDDELVVFCSPNHPYAKLKKLDDEQLVTADWILRERGSGTRQAFDRAMVGLQSDMNIFLELEHTEAIKRAVESGVGIGCLSKIVLQDAFDAGRLIPLLTPQREMRRKFYLIMHNKKYVTGSLKKWIAYCDNYLKDVAS